MSSAQPSHLIPPQWERVRLGDHTTKIGSGITPSGGQANYQQSGIPLIRSQNVLLNRFSLQGLAYISPDQDARMEGTRVLPGDVLLNITGASIGRVCVVPSELCPANVNQHVSIIRCKDSIDPRFLSLYLSTPDFQRFILDSQAGATRQALTKALIENFQVPLPGMTEQQQIATTIYRQLELIDQARAAVAAQLGVARALPVAFLRDAFDSDDSRKWPVRRLCELIAEPVRTGISKPASPSADKFCLTLSSVRAGALDVTQVKSADVTDAAAEGCWVKANAFYVVRGNGNRTLVGRGALAPDSVPKILFPDLLIQVIPDALKISPRFLRLVWDSPQVRIDIESRARTSAGIFKINQANLGAISIPCPPTDLQESLCATVEEKLLDAYRLQRALALKADAIDGLVTGYLRTAFQIGM